MLKFIGLALASTAAAVALNGLTPATCLGGSCADNNTDLTSCLACCGNEEGAGACQRQCALHND